MIIYKRNVDGETVAETHGYCNQAAFNSDGMLTIRTTIKGLAGEEKEEQMLVLNQSETNAIFELMRKIARYAKTDLPF